MSAKNTYWRSLNELNETPEFEQSLQREFPVAAAEFPEGVSRRRWMKLMSASMGLAGVAGCRYGPDKIMPFVIRPENTVAGIPKHYATNFELAGRAVHLLVSNLDGRPIKIEGNAQHPLMRSSEPNDLGEAGDKSRFASAGTDVYSQACILGLYDPDRTDVVTKRVDGASAESSWEEFAEYALSHFESLKSKQGESLAVVMSPSLSPAINGWVADLAKQLPKTSVVQYSSVDNSAQTAACTQAVGRPAELLFNLREARVVCALDSDLLGNDPNMVIYSRQFSKGRLPEPGKMNRLYAAESRYSVTGTSADSRLPIRSSQIGALVARLEKEVDRLLGGGQVATAAESELPYDEVKDSQEKVDRFVQAMAEDLFKHKGAGVVAVGAHLPADVQLAALRLNKKLGNVDKTVMLMPSRTAIAGVEPQSVGDLVEKLSKGSIDTVWILGDNPVYAVPGDVALSDALKKVEHSVYLAEFIDETSEKCAWNVPLAHQLESWGDVLGVDGSYGVGQPQILPLLNGKSAPEILAMLIGKPEDGEKLIRASAGKVVGKQMTSRAWRDILHDGYLVDSQAKPISAEWKVDGAPPAGAIDLDAADASSIEVLIVPSDTLYDGRFAKNVWLQELPQAVTKLTWDNAAMISPTTAKELKVKQGDLIRLQLNGKQLELPVFEMPGQAKGAISVHLGYGRVCRDEAVDSNKTATVGKDVAVLRTLKNMHVVTGVEARGTSRPYKLATTQDHFAIEDLGLNEIKRRANSLIRETTLEQFEEGGKDFIQHKGTHFPNLESMWREPMEKIEAEDTTVPYQWAMTIDLNKCTGCNACVVACQAENNIPVVGKEQVSRGREMHWIRVDRYFQGDVETPKIVTQPVACVHCETAPCEQVCPVAATVHTEEGINAMAYNRCVGTRYCANNCPYKVRRFNYFNYNTEYGYFYGWERRGELEKASRKLQQLVLNPEVTVRGRGIMEKCTYCIQRIQNVKIHSRNEGRMVEDGEVQTACQSACASQAIVFGNKKDSSTRVAKLSRDERNYAMLEELNIKPRTTYLARVRNTHPRLKTSDQLVDPHHGSQGHADEHLETHS